MFKLMKSALAFGLAFVLTSTVAYAREVNTALLLADGFIDALSSNSFTVSNEVKLTYEASFDFAGLETYEAKDEATISVNANYDSGDLYLSLTVSPEEYDMLGYGIDDMEIAVLNGGYFVKYGNQWMRLGESTYGASLTPNEADWEGLREELHEALGEEIKSHISSYTLVGRDGNYYHRVAGRVSPQHNYQLYSSQNYQTMTMVIAALFAEYAYSYGYDSYGYDFDETEIITDLSYAYYVNALTGKLEEFEISLDYIAREDLSFVDSEAVQKYGVNFSLMFTDFDKKLQFPDVSQALDPYALYESANFDDILADFESYYQ